MEQSKLEIMRHSAAHVLAAAVLELFPNAKFGVGPVVENGFYYDFDLGKNLTAGDLPKIESKMRDIVKRNIPFERQELSRDEAIEIFETLKQPYKVELLREGTVGEEGKMESLGERVTIYKTGKFTDLCRGPHVSTTRGLGVLKLTTVAGAYWRGDENKPMLQRVYGVAFETQKELDEYLKMREEAEKRDHRKLGKELDLFTFSKHVGSGLPLFTPKGALIRRLLNEYVESLQARAGYTQVWTPQMVKGELFKISGHYDKYKDDMFRVVSNYSKEEFFLKPMNCPQHTQIYASQPRSYRDLPLRYSDFAMLYRDEKPGELSGLARVRSFSQDDCHIFCREDQVDEEIDIALAMTKKIMATFGLKYRYRLSTRDPKHKEKYIGDPKIWDKAEQWAEKIMKRNGIEYFDGPGEAAFYAPKMDLIATDALGRDWQLSTVQIDYVMPERFDLSYNDADGQKKRPIMIHRAIIGSPERFMMILLEHLAGAFPTWLAPVQVAVIPVGKRHVKAAHKLGKMFREEGIRVGVEDANETVGYKIRKAEKQKSPYMLVIGDKEMGGKKLNVRVRGKQKTVAMTVKKFIEKVKTEIEKRK